MSKLTNLEDKIPLSFKMKPLKLINNSGQQGPPIGQYQSGLPESPSKKNLQNKKEYRNRDIPDNQSQSRSYSQMSQQYQTNSFVKT